MTYSNNKHMKKSNLRSFLRFFPAGFFLTFAVTAVAQNGPVTALYRI